MSLFTPLSASQLLLEATGTKLSLLAQHRIPDQGRVIVISNHRSFLDVPILIKSVGRSVRIACHHYMGQTPILREIVDSLGCFPLESPQNRHNSFFERATQFLQSQQWIGLFPEGGTPMVHLTQPRELTPFHKGFAHLALKSQIENLAVLPVAIISTEETAFSAFPLRLLQLFDPSEPLFDHEGWHPVVLYHHVKVYIGRPYWITQEQRQRYQGKTAKQAVSELTDYCYQEIAQLLEQG